MNILETKPIWEREIALGRTPRGRAINEYAFKALESMKSDEKNYSMNAIQCRGCGFVISSLLVADGCPNCGAIDLSENVSEE